MEQVEPRKRKISDYPDYYEWSRDYPEQAKELRDDIVDALPFDLNPRHLDKLCREAWAELVLQEMEREGKVYKTESGAYMPTDPATTE